MKKLALLLILVPVSLLAQTNTRYDSIAYGPRGPIPNAFIAVCTQPANVSATPCTPLAALCSSTIDVTCTQPNPIQSDVNGNFHFYAVAINAPYTVQIYGPQVSTPYVLTDQYGGFLNVIGGSGNIFAATNNVFTGTNTFNNSINVTGGIGLGGATPFGNSINAPSTFSLAINGNSIMGATTAGIIPIGIGPGPNNRCQVDGILHLNIKACADLQGGVSGLRSLIIETNTPEDLTANPWPVNEAAELRIGTGLKGTLCDTTHILCWVSEVPNILGAGSSITGTGKYGAFNATPTDISSASPWVTGNNWPPPLGVPTGETVGPAGCNATGGGLSNGTYFVYVRTANNLQTHAGDPPTAGPSMHSTEFSVTCTNGGALQSITISSPNSVGNIVGGNDFRAKDFQVAASTVSGQEQIQINDSAGANVNMNCLLGTVSAFNNANYGCQMGSTATLKTIITGTRFFQDTDLSNPAWVIGPNQTVTFVTMITGLSLICGPVNALPTTGGFTQGYNVPNWLIWNQSGEELVGIDPLGLGIDGPCGGYSTGTNATGGSATPFGGGWIYEDTKTPNGLLEHVQTGGSAPSCGGSCASNTPFNPFYFDCRPDGQGGAAGCPRIVNDITATPKNSGAYVPAVFYVQGLRARIHFSNIHIETNQPTSSDGIQCDNGAYCYADGVEAQTATVGTLLHLTSTGAHFSGSAVCPIGTATSLQDRCAGTGGMKTFKDDTTGGISYVGYMETFGSGTYFSRSVQLVPLAFANLVACGATTQGMESVVNNSNTVVFNANIAGGGANIVGALCNGTNWVVH